MSSSEEKSSTEGSAAATPPKPDPLNEATPVKIAGSEPAPASPKTSKEDDTVAGIIGLGIIVVVAGLIYFASFGKNDTFVTYAAAELKCVPPVTGAEKNAAGEKEPAAVSCVNQPDSAKYWLVTGRVLKNGSPVDQAVVWAVADDDAGNSYSPPAEKSDIDGAFKFKLIPHQLEGHKSPIKSILVNAVKEDPGWIYGKTIEKSLPTALSVGPLSTRSSPYQYTGWFLVPVIIFLFSVGLAYIPEDSRWTSVRYFLTCALPLFMTGFMVGIVGWNMKYFHSEVANKDEEYQSLGFVHFFKATYVKEEEPEWLISFTARPEGYADAIRKKKHDKEADALRQKKQEKEADARAIKTEEKKNAVEAPKPAPDKEKAIDQKKPAEPGKAEEKNGMAKQEPKKEKDDNKKAEEKTVTAKQESKKEKEDNKKEKEKGLNIDYIRGFGAPFWVIFVSVFGTSLLIIVLVVSGVVERPTFPLDMYANRTGEVSAEERKKEDENRKKFRDNTRNIIVHQFYLMFAPFSGVFVYQFLVMGEAASHTTMVALTVLGAGLALNVILARGVRLAEELVKRPDEKK